MTADNYFLKQFVGLKSIDQLNYLRILIEDIFNKTRTEGWFCP